MVSYRCQHEKVFLFWKNVKEFIMGRLKEYLKNVKKELKKVRWLTKKEMIKYSGATLLFILVFSFFFSLADIIIAIRMPLTRDVKPQDTRHTKAKMIRPKRTGGQYLRSIRFHLGTFFRLLRRTGG